MVHTCVCCYPCDQHSQTQEASEPHLKTWSSVGFCCRYKQAVILAPVANILLLTVYICIHLQGITLDSASPGSRCMEGQCCESSTSAHKSRDAPSHVERKESQHDQLRCDCSRLDVEKNSEANAMRNRMGKLSHAYAGGDLSHDDGECQAYMDRPGPQLPA